MKLPSILMIACVLLSSCRSMVGVDGRGDALAVVTVDSASSERIRAASIEVFREEGFDKLYESPRSITFQKVGGRSADIAWKTLGNSNPVMIRPTVDWRPSGGSETRLSCSVEVAQASTVYGETVREPLMAGKGAYRGMLKEIKRRAEATDS